ncbi:DUF3592 domain-containing protein [Pontiella desulfatans]
MSFVLPLGFILFGYSAFKYGISRLIKSLKSRSWPTTIGSVSYSELHKLRSQKTGIQYQYKPRIRYEFIANDQVLSSNKIFFGEYTSSNKSRIESLLSKYPLGSDVTVIYNPDNPEEAILEPIISIGTIFSLIAGIVFTGSSYLAFIILQAFALKEM